MLQTVKISSKRQITIPAALFNELNLEKGDQLVAKIEDNKLIMKKKRDILDKLAGSLKTPKKYQHLSLDEIIEQGKKEYFARKYASKKP